MHKNKFLKLVFVLIFSISVSDITASGWTQKKGSGYFQLSTTIVVADEYFEPGGNKIGITTMGDYTFSLYGEYGLTNDLTLFGSFPFIKRITLNKIEGRQTGFEFFPGDSKTGISDFDIGLRYSIGRLGSTSFTAGVLLGVPIGDNEQKNGLFTGDGEFNQQVFIGFGQSFNSPLYMAGRLGYNNRTDGFSDEVRYNFEIGYRITNPLLVIMKARGVETMRNGRDALQSGTAGLFGNNQQYLTYGPEVIYSLTNNIGLNAGAYTATRAENVVSGISYKFGVYYKLN